MSDKQLYDAIGKQVYAFTGTRRGMTPQQHEEVHRLLAHARMLHNGAARGADSDAARIAEMHMIPVVAHPAEGVKPGDKAHIQAVEWWDSLPPLERNRVMVDECDELIATPSGFVEQMRGSGTWATIRYAVSIGKPLIVIWPDGITSRTPTYPNPT